MKTKKVARSALFTSVLALVLCVSMLVGTTFAWFTDSVTSKNNIIKAGNLDVELYNSIGIEDAKKVGSETALFEEIELWEPGVVAYENLTVANVGTLALKYQLSINFANAVATPDGKTLADVLKVAIVKDGITTDDRDALIASIPAADWKELKTFEQAGQLTAGTNNTEAFGVVIYWQPGENDNDYNMNNGQTTKLSVDLGVHLYATQLVHEEDSFGPDYDENAPYTEVRTYEELAAVIAEGGSMILLNDITVPADTTLTVAAGKTVTINTNGYAISATSAQSNSNHDLFLVKGTLNITGNGAVTYEHTGTDMEWSRMSTVLDITAGGAVYLSGGVTVENLGGTAMNFGAHLNNWGSASLYLDDATIKAPYCAIRVYNSGYDMNSVVAKDSSIISSNRALWVQNYTDADFGNDGDPTREEIDARLNIDIDDASNLVAGKIVYGFTDATTIPSAVTVVTDKGGLAAAEGKVVVLEDLAIDDGTAIKNAAEIDFGRNTLSRDTASGNPFMISTTEKVVLENAVFESVKGSAVLETRTNGADITIKDSVFNDLANPSTGNVGIQVYAQNVTMKFVNCEFNNMPIVTNSSYPKGITLEFEGCTFNWVGDNCPGMIQLANDVEADLDFTDCTFTYETSSQYNTSKDLIATRTSVGPTTIDFNGLTVVGTRNNENVWDIVGKGGVTTGNNVTVTVSGAASYTFNNTALNVSDYLFR